MKTNKEISMKLYRIIIITSFIFSVPWQVFPQDNLAKIVNPFIGTDAHGHTYPGASLPFGMVQLSPDTDTKGWDWCSGYHYSDKSLIGFSHTHLSGTGCADYGDILIMPTTGILQVEPGPKDNPDLGYRSRFSHDKEKASAGYYSVALDDYGINAELTVTRRAGFHKYTFPASDQSNIIIDLLHGIDDKVKEAKIDIVENRIIKGYRRSTGWANDQIVYFYAELSKPFNTYGTVNDGRIEPNNNSLSGKNVKAFLGYKTSEQEAILLKIGISHVSIEGAENNLKKEIPGWNFEQVKDQAEKEWNKELSKITVEGTDKQKEIFYTALYHAVLNPNTASDADGSFRGMDGKIYNSKDTEMYTVFSLWDTFRAAHPLFTLIDPNRARDMVRTLIKKYEEGGLLPVWELASNETGTMIGYHAVPVIADAYFKGITDFDAGKAFEAMKKSAMQDHLGLESYKEMGFIPADAEHESVSKTLEYAYDDWCIAKMAKALGRMEDYKYFSERALFYNNVFDPSTNLMRPKRNGRWVDPFDPYAVSGDYTEANSWQYSFFVPQDVKGLMKLMGGEEAFVSKLDELFTTNPKLTGRFQSDITGLIGQYAHGNEPSHHMAYLYNYAGSPWKTQERVHEIVTTLYTEKPDGLCGNEDCGQMSSWYVFSAMGFYPVRPGDENYVLGTPSFNKMTLNTGKSKFTVIAKNLSDKNYYVQSVKLNGKAYEKSYISHSEILKGGELLFEMGPEPNKQWGNKEGKPVSAMDVNSFVPVPYLISGDKIFEGSMNINLKSIDGADIYYTIDNSIPDKNSTKYGNPITIDKNFEINAVSYIEGKGYSKVVKATFHKIPEGRKVSIKHPYNSSYTGGGELGLIDMIKGNESFRTGAWQGYEQVDFDAVVDLGKEQTIKGISTSFLQNPGSWIFLPESVEYYISKDGEIYQKVFEEKNKITEKSKPEIKEFNINLSDISARYIRVLAKNMGICPDWHFAAGGKAWIFIDEITIK